MEIQALSHFTNPPALRSNSSTTSRRSSFPSLRNRSLLWGHTIHFKLPSPTINSKQGAHSLSVQCAITRSKKEEIVGIVKEELVKCHLIAGIKYEGLTVKQMEDLRKALPETSKLIVAKNRLVGKALEGTPWEALKPCMRGMNAFMFVHSEEIPVALKPYREFQKQQKLETNDFVGAVFEGKFYAPDEFKALETMPTRAEVYAKLLVSLQTPAISLVTTLQAPARDLVLTLKAYVQKLEEESGNATTS